MFEYDFHVRRKFSLASELQPISISDVKIGDVFIQGGFPGHAIIVVDQAINTRTNEIALLLAQSYMPAQQIHVLRNNHNYDLSPWFVVKATDKFYTPEWTFEWSDIRRFRQQP
ncbi:hypothetical protein JW960_18400 [candidate division KSB1 bacterium]|nr:hypothetical protein [candidate division KSB1 bacterium]